jgi:dephospho-CoA kinase
MSDRPLRVIGLTGGIATGKSTVSNYLANQHHLPIFDADIYAREAVEPGSAVLERIVDRYGTEILLADGTLNRRRLGEAIFNNFYERQWLEQQIHPYVRDRLKAALNYPTAPVLVLAIPLLFEAQMTDLVTEIWVVCCSPERQLERLMKRDRLTLEEARLRIDSQMPIADKCDRADVVLDNSSTLEALCKQIDLVL